MKAKLPLLFLGILCICSNLFAQENAMLQELLDRLSENHYGAVSDVFTAEEIHILQNHFSEVNTTNALDESILLRERISTTQAVTVVTAADILPNDLNIIEHLNNSPNIAFQGAGVVMGPSANLRGIIVDNDNVLYGRDLISGVYTTEGSLINTIPGESITGIEILSDNTSMYGISTNGNSGILNIINPVTREVTQVGDTGLTLPINLARDENDNLFTVDIDDDNLYQLDRNTGAATLIGPIGFNANFGQGMCFDQFNNRILMTAFNNALFDSELREVNTTTGLSTSLGTIVPGTTYQFGWGSMYDRDVLAVAEDAFDGFKMYPNPASTVVHLEANEVIERVVIYSVLGQKEMDRELDLKASEIDISTLQSGSYFIKVTTAQQSGTYKLIKL